MKAFTITEPHTTGVVERSLPRLRDDYILVKVVSVALNPTDWKHIKGTDLSGQLVGCDYSGIVEAVGESVQKSFKRGDRVCGMVHGCNALQNEDGAFAEYIVAKGDLQWHIPESVSFQEAATFGVGIVTVVQCLYQGLELNWPDNSGSTAHSAGEFILIYGASTATGYLAVQFAKLSGYTVIATCSSHNFDLVQNAGADAVFDYKDPSSVDKIREYAHGGLKFVMNCVGDKTSEEFYTQILRPEEASVTSVNGQTAMVHLAQESGAGPRKAKRTEGSGTSSYAFAYTAFGESLSKFGKSIAARPEDKEYIVSFGPLIESLLGQGKVKAIPHIVREGGLFGIAEGLLSMERGEVSGNKLVYNNADTASE